MATANKVDAAYRELHGILHTLDNWLSKCRGGSQSGMTLVLGMDAQGFYATAEWTEYYGGYGEHTHYDYGMGRGPTVERALVDLAPQLRDEIDRAKRRYKELYQ